MRKQVATVKQADTKIKQDSPIPMEVNLGKCALFIKNTCGSCVHFKRMAYPKFKQPCVNLGIISDSKPCSKYAINPAKIKFTEDKHLRNVTKAIDELTVSQLKLVSALLNQEERTRKAGFKAGMIVYFNMFGPDYLSNYVKAKVIWADSTYVHVEGDNGCVATFYHKSVMRYPKWKKKELELLKTNKIKDPKYKMYFKVETKVEKEIRAIIEKTSPVTLNSDIKDKSSRTIKSQTSTRTMDDKHLIVR